MDLKIHPVLPQRKDFRIGILGSGVIVNDCHLVAYRKAGFNPVAIASRHRENAARVAQRHVIPKVCDSYEQLLDDPAIEVLDIAVPPNAQLGLIYAACQRRIVKGILAQKPLGMNYAEAVAAVRACEAAGIRLAVNQNMRYDQSVRAAKTLLQSGTLGESVLATIEMRGIPYTTPSTIRWAAKGDKEFHRPGWTESWFPDAFVGTMAQLLVALETGTEPEISGRDNLNTMALVDAAYQSAAQFRSIDLDEVERFVGTPVPDDPKMERAFFGGTGS